MFGAFIMLAAASYRNEDWPLIAFQVAVFKFAASFTAACGFVLLGSQVAPSHKKTVSKTLVCLSSIGWGVFCIRLMLLGERPILHASLSLILWIPGALLGYKYVNEDRYVEIPDNRL